MAKPLGLSETQLKIWRLINDLAQDYGAWIVSPPDTSPIRLECLDVALPLQLSRMHFDITAMGTNDRLVPSVVTEERGGKTFTANTVAPGTVLVYEVKLETEFEPSKTSTVPSS